ncbi:MAG TPA: ribosome small subunit-dependent GTPase A [Bacteroidetes bacterium]|nr:ribosome small subunit-dependent GTPase A [Bacteroidota bacterium]
MKPEDLGYTGELEKYREENHLLDLETGRVVAEHRERYLVRTTEGEYEAEITGNMRYTAESREDFPAVGDWVALQIYGPGSAIIHHVFPRFSVLKRQAAGKPGEIQVLAANVDTAFLVQSVDRDFNLNRLERYLTLCHASGVSPVILLSKVDLIDRSRLDEMIRILQARITHVPVLPISNETQEGYSSLQKMIKKGKTYCMLGSSGVGKSTLLNHLSGKNLMRTGGISRSTGKGRHVTSHRELILLDQGGILIDNPGMREVGMADTGNGLEVTFDRIYALARHCRYRDCTHTREAGCAVLRAVENGEIDTATYDNFLKMEKEKTHFESTMAERRRKEKMLGKIIRDYHKKDIKRKKH